MTKAEMLLLGLNDLVDFADSQECRKIMQADIRNYTKRAKVEKPQYNIDVNLAIKKVIFNDPATIVFWKDGSKTIVKAQSDDVYDKEKGLALAIVKKLYGNTGNYWNLFNKFI